MYRAIYYLHSYWAYLVLLVVILASLNAITGVISKRSYGPRDFRISLFALICTHIQLLIGIVLFFISPKIVWFTEGVPVKEIMGDSDLRMYNVRDSQGQHLWGKNKRLGNILRPVNIFYTQWRKFTRSPKRAFYE